MSSPASKKRRFAPAKNSEEVEEAQKKAIPAKTEQSTAWALKTWQAWASQRLPSDEGNNEGPEMQHLLSNDLDKMSNQELNFWMPRFILEVRKRNGQEYPPNSLYQMICGLQRHVQRTRPSISFFTPVFANIERTLDAEMKRLRSTGLGVEVKKAEPISVDEEEQMWQCGALGDDNPQVLLQTVLYLIGVHFALRSGSEHRRLRHKNSQLQLLLDDDQPRLVYNEDVSKTFQGGLKSRKVTSKVVTCYPRRDMPERCLIRLYQKYNKLCPSDRPDDAFYLKPLDSPRDNQWYSRAPLGHNTLSEMVPQLCTKAGITGRKTNHSLRATCATRLYQEGVDEQLIMENTGHRSVHGVRSYKRTSSEQKKALSEVLNVGGNPESRILICCDYFISEQPKTYCIRSYQRIHI